MSQQQLPGSHLLAALHSQMERMNNAVRVCKAASKTPHSRTSTDIQLIAAETQDILLLNREGPAVHRELCHVVQALQLKQMEALRLPGHHKSAVFGHVMAGKLQLRAKSKAGFDKSHEARTDSTGGNSCSSNFSDLAPLSPAEGSGTKGSEGVAHGHSMTGSNSSSSGARSKASKNSRQGDLSATEDQLRALFNSIDVDGSGAIEVDQLQQALSVMGIDKQLHEVQELMDSVDKDGSGELEFEEFVLVLTTKMAVGCQHESAWQELPDGTWSCELTEGGCFGELALVTGEMQDGLILATEDSMLLLLDAASYTNILKHGFDGQLNAKMAVIRNCPGLASCLSTRSDIRGLAYAAVNETHSWGGQLYAAGEIPTALYVIQEGACKIVATKMTNCEAQLRSSATAGPDSLNADAESLPSARCACVLPGSDVAAEAAAATLITSPQYGLHSARSRLTARRTELAVLGPGDIAGEACVLGLSQHSSSALVSSAEVIVLRMALQDIKQHLHSADLQRLVHILQQRDEQRHERLEAAAAVTCTAAVQQHQYREIAEQDQSAAKSTTAAAPPVAEMLPSGLGLLNGSRSGPERSISSTCRRPGLQLPSTAGSAAAAIIAAGGCSPRLDVPSAIQRQKIAAVKAVVKGLLAAHQVDETMHSAMVGAAVAALQTARAATAATAAQYDTRIPFKSVSSPGTALSECDRSARCSRRQQQLLSSRSSPGSGRLGGIHSRSQPGSSRQLCCVQTTADDLVLPLGLQTQSIVLLGDSETSADSRESKSSRSDRHSRRRTPVITSAVVLSSPVNSPRNASPVLVDVSQANGLHHLTDCYTEAAAASAPVGKAVVELDATPQPQQQPKKQVQCNRAATSVADNVGSLQSTCRQPYQASVAAAAVVAEQEIMATNGVSLHNSPTTSPRNSGARQLQATGTPRLSGTPTRSARWTGTVMRESGAACQAVIRQQLAATATPSNCLADNTLVQPTSVDAVTHTEVLGSKTARPSVAKPVALGVLSVVDEATWTESETAADASSWLIHRQLAQSEGSKQRQRQVQPQQRHEEQQKQPCHQQQVLQADLLRSIGPMSTVGLAFAGNPVVPESVLTLHQSMKQRAVGIAVLQDVRPHAPQRQMREWLAADRSVPKLLLHEMQQSLVGGTPRKPSSSSSSSSISQSAGMNRRENAKYATGCSPGAVEYSSYQCNSSDRAGPLTPMCGATSSVKKSTSAKSWAAGAGSKQQQQQEQQQQEQQQQRQEQQSVTNLPALLPSFRSSLTSKWQPGGRFTPC